MNNMSKEESKTKEESFEIIAEEIPLVNSVVSTVTSRRSKRFVQGIPVERITMSDVKGKDDGGITSDLKNSDEDYSDIMQEMPSQVKKSILFIGAQASGKSSLALALTGTCFESVYGANSGTTDIRVFNGHFHHKGVDYGITVSDSVGQTGERGDDSSKLYDTFYKLSKKVTTFDRIFVVLSFSSRKSLILIGVLDMIRDYLTEEAKERIYFVITRVLPHEEETTTAMVKEAVKGFGDISDRILCVDLPDQNAFRGHEESTSLIKRRWNRAKCKLIDIITSDHKSVLVETVFKKYDIQRDLRTYSRFILTVLVIAILASICAYLAYYIYNLEPPKLETAANDPSKWTMGQIWGLALKESKLRISNGVGNLTNGMVKAIQGVFSFSSAK